ncbi:MAG: 30S ribosomal protein S4 [Candidatus Micrarchaeia archaeon]
MGAPKRLRKKYETPGLMWNTQRIARHNELKNKYGLKNMREVWLAESELRRIRKNVRSILAGVESEETGRGIIRRLATYGIVSSNATLDTLLSLQPDALLERRLQTVVYKKGLARTLRQARQLITHGFIAINGRKVTSPGYMVRSDEEHAIGYYKPIDLNAGMGGATSGASTTQKEEAIAAQTEGEESNTEEGE